MYGNRPVPGPLIGNDPGPVAADPPAPPLPQGDVNANPAGIGFWALVGSGVLLFLIAPLIQKLMHGVK